MRIVGLVAVVALSACATSSKDIASGYTSPILYRGLSCQQLEAEVSRIQVRARELARAADSDANSDTAKLVIGATPWTWPVLFFIEGDGSRAAEYGQLKGEAAAINEVQAEKECRVTLVESPQQQEPRKIAKKGKSS